MVRGRKPMSQEAKEQSGSFVKHPERRNKSAPKVQYGTPPVPDTIKDDPVASDKWTQLCQELAKAGVLATMDGDLLEAYCMTYSMYRTALAQVQKEGNTVIKANGDPMRNPACVELAQTMQRMGKLMTELGITPSARSRITAAPQTDEDDPFEELMKRMGTG